MFLDLFTVVKEADTVFSLLGEVVLGELFKDVLVDMFKDVLDDFSKDLFTRYLSRKICYLKNVPKVEKSFMHEVSVLK